MSRKVLGWNINQRSGLGKEIPELVFQELLEQDADVIVLTEVVKNDSLSVFLQKMRKAGYESAISKNENTNEVCILWKVEYYQLLNIDDSLITAKENDNPNYIEITGYVCKEPVFRTTPFKREITDVLLAVNRSYNKSDYLPCIAWGRNARFVKTFSVGDKVTVTGRIQSRDYQKKVNDELITKTAYEVSLNRIELVKDENDVDMVMTSVGQLENYYVR